MSLSKFRISAKCFFFDSHNRVLLVKGQRPEKGENYWSTPGGGVEEGESVYRAAERELTEETGYAGRVEKIVFAQDYPNQDHGRNFEIFMVGNIDESIAPRENCDHEPRFFSEAEFKYIYFLPEGVNPFELRRNNKADYKTYLR